MILKSLAKEKLSSQKIYNIDKDKEKYWSPIDFYVGGAEHATRHLIYARFWHKFLYDLKLVPTSEPYMKRTSHGMILAAEGEKMSKSKFNVKNPDDIIAQYGSDTFRMYEMFLGPLEQSKPWDTKGIDGVHRFLRKFWRLFFDNDGNLDLAIANGHVQDNIQQIEKNVPYRQTTQLLRNNGGSPLTFDDPFAWEFPEDYEGACCRALFGGFQVTVTGRLHLILPARRFQHWPSWSGWRTARPR